MIPSKKEVDSIFLPNGIKKGHEEIASMPPEKAIHAMTYFPAGANASFPVPSSLNKSDFILCEKP